MVQYDEASTDCLIYQSDRNYLKAVPITFAITAEEVKII